MPRTHEKVSHAPDTPCFQPGGSAELLQRGLRVLDGRWKLAILLRLLRDSPLRFSALERDIPGISQKMLAQHLRDLERDGLVTRTIHPEIPPRVEYAPTGAGVALRPALEMLRAWSAEHLEEKRE